MGDHDYQDATRRGFEALDRRDKDASISAFEEAFRLARNDRDYPIRCQTTQSRGINTHYGPLARNPLITCSSGDLPVALRLEEIAEYRTKIGFLAWHSVMRFRAPRYRELS